AIPWRRPQDLLRRPRYRELVMTSLAVQHVDAATVADSLRSHFAMQRQWQPGAPTVTFVGERSLILHGYGDQIAQTIQAVRELDRLAAPPVVATDTAAAMLLRLEALEREVRELRRALAAVAARDLSTRPATGK
ncbi:MAG: hypothetical protein KAI24_21125, partial [Planctomycetes bacterium]|nr:hypothetical protein [Planctomycetota bacterium]